MSDIAQTASRKIPIYRGMDQASLDAAYNNGAAVPDNAGWLDKWRERSAMIRESKTAQLDIPYSSKVRTRLDYFPSGVENAPVFVFIHGGYWQRNAKELFSFAANGPVTRGINAAVIGYTLAPEASLTEIVSEIRQGLAFLHQNGSRFGFNAEQIYVGGWSAGGHLSALVCDEPAVKGSLAISGIFDLEPIALSYINAPLQLHPDEIETLSPLRTLKSGSARQCITVGGNELLELQRQSSLYVETARMLRLPATIRTLPGHHHFSILDELFEPAGMLTAELLKLIEVEGR